MAEDLRIQARDLLEGQIDFEGQKQAEWISTTLIVLTGIVSFFAGYVTQNVYTSLFVGIAGMLITFAVVVPPWAAYNQHPLRWYSHPAIQSAKSGSKGAGQTLMFGGQQLTI